MKTFILALTALLFLTGCQESPTGRNRLALVPNVVMTDMGEQSFEQMKQQIPVITRPDINRLVQCITGELVATLEEAPVNGVSLPDSWEVVVFDNPSPNAFALPGGKIGVHSGLLRVADNPAQLAAVIGHEIAHVLADHGNERLTQQLGLKAGMLLIGLFTESEIAEDQIQQALGLGAQLGITLPFSRAHEEEADLLGLSLMARAGFEPGESVRLWQNMAQASGNQPLEFLSTHPSHDTRIESLRQQMSAASTLYEAAEPARCGA
ncbi:M48 family peptidase [Marinobacter lipolyticus]|uniref:M48 family metallopeptidase n=1 Tax=Marinobacter lipolyticus TaxID=209639 RepID=UPI002B1CC131|nr:M48 family metallopeptidase [Marinobacter lipolyticus]MBS8240906.1 M48 family peptidase [Marinobacter lipolyticus]